MSGGGLSSAGLGEAFCQGEGVGRGLAVDFGEGGGEQAEGAGDGVVPAEAALGADEVAVDRLVVGVEGAGVFEPVEYLPRVLGGAVDEGGQGVEDLAAEGFPPRGELFSEKSVAYQEKVSGPLSERSHRVLGRYSRTVFVVLGFLIILVGLGVAVGLLS